MSIERIAKMKREHPEWPNELVDLNDRAETLIDQRTRYQQKVDKIDSELEFIIGYIKDNF
jgi:hypothetical protein